MKNSDMPAMPMLNSDGFPMERGNVGEYYKEDCIGLTKLEYFAGLAMQGYITATGAIHGPEVIAGWAVQNAQAVLEELEKEQSK